MNVLLVLLGLYGCSTAKDAYVESKYNICREKCNFTYSKYEGSKLGQCLSDCSRDKTIK